MDYFSVFSQIIKDVDRSGVTVTYFWNYCCLSEPVHTFFFCLHWNQPELSRSSQLMLACNHFLFRNKSPLIVGQLYWEDIYSCHFILVALPQISYPWIYFYCAYFCLMDAWNHMIKQRLCIAHNVSKWLAFFKMFSFHKACTVHTTFTIAKGWQTQFCIRLILFLWNAKQMFLLSRSFTILSKARLQDSVRKPRRSQDLCLPNLTDLLFRQ